MQRAMSLLRAPLLLSAPAAKAGALRSGAQAARGMALSRTHSASTHTPLPLSLQEGGSVARRRPAALWQARRAHGHGHSHGDEPEGPTVKVTFIYEKDGSRHTVDGKVGMSVLRVAHAHGIDLEGACEASLACSTCHVVLSNELYDKLEEPTDDENDMLDLAFGLTDSSRLGCQVFLTEDMEGAEFKIPSATRNMYVDGHVPKPH